jgi:hypothetical protein
MSKDLLPNQKGNEESNTRVITKKRITLDVAKEKVGNSTMHAIPNIVRTEYKTVKIFWALAFLVATGFTIYCIPYFV